MRKVLTFLLVTILHNCVNGQAEYCPEEDITIYFSFQDPRRYEISTTPSNLKGVTVVKNITAGGGSNGTCYAIIKFADKKGPHQFRIYDHLEKLLTSTKYEFKRVKTLEGNKPQWSPYPPPSVSPFAEWDDVFDEVSVGAFCKTQSFTYTGPEVNYKDSDGNTYGAFSMNLYEWLLPKGFKIGNEVSDGVNVITTVSSAATITPDPVSWGEIKMRATNNCSPYTLKKSDWYRIKLLDRHELRLSVDGVNPIQVVCDDVALRTFAVENISSQSCISGYSWTIGSNWLLEDGSPAPATLTTTFPFLKLKPVGNAAPGAIKVRLIVNGQVNVNEMSCGVNFVNNPPDPFSISGVREICSGQKTFSVAGGNVISWSVSPLGQTLASTAVNGNNITLTKTGTKSGYITLRATKQNSCGAQRESYEKIVAIGSPPPMEIGEFPDITTPTFGGDSYYTFSVSSFMSISGYEWATRGCTIYSGQGTNSITVYMPPNTDPPSSMEVKVKWKNACGWSSYLTRRGIIRGGAWRIASSDTTKLAIVDQYTPTDSIPLVKDLNKNLNISISPNPSQKYIVIKDKRVEQTQASNIGFRRINIFTANGALLKTYNYQPATNQIQIDVSSLHVGTYFVEVFDGERRLIKPLIIVR
ncbi:MAG: T9SS type A sorting domain-containing protein [Agriterribacter sp.]